MPRAVRALLLVLAIVAPGRRAEARDVHANDGLALGVGIGSDSAGLGGFAAYYLAWPERRLGLMPHVGLGSALFVVDAGPRVSAGITGSFGRCHRLVIDLHVAPVGFQTLTLHGERLDVHNIYGIGLAIGWEWLTASGFFMRINFGPAFAFLPPLYRTRDAWTLSGNLLSLGVKLW